MNKIARAILLLFAFSSFFYSQNVLVAGAEMSDEEIAAKAGEMSLRLDGVKNKKEKIALYEEFAEMFFSQGVYEAASDIYARLLESKPSKKKKAEYYVKLGDIEAAKKSYNAGLEYYKSALALYGRNNEIRRKIGDILLESNLYNLAEQSFKDILEIDKNYDYAKRKLGDIYYQQKRYSKALGYYEGINKAYYDKDTVVNMVFCYKNLNKPDKAEILVNDFLKDFPSSEMYFLSGQMYAGMREYDKAEKQFLLAIQFDDSNFSAYVYLASIYLENNEIEKAEEMLQKAKAINSYSAAVDLMLARVSYVNGRIYEARRYASSAVLKAKTPFLKQQSQRMLDFFNEQK